ncbi:MAG: sulfite reductase subunit C [Firmicutes bacterium HGW-Firmicutes-1]|jgi:anaerobic sulfite reductase subunit C|nr:MAG: sulfite reductase subunit C [Firmicutes bacterium HGW-Firmicutes-1]
MSIDRKKITKNAYRVTKERGKTALRIRVPGGHIETEYFNLIHSIATEYGNGTVHITTRQGFEIPDIDFDKIPEINGKIKPLIESLGLALEVTDGGYPSAGTRNISACIGNRVCPFANDDTTSFAKELEKAVYPNDFHFKIAVTGCPNDCIKAYMQDFGIICTVEPIYEESKCISCNACVDNCSKRVTGALEMKDFSIVRDEKLCIGCGECIRKCPTGAWKRSKQIYYRMVIMGRTGKKNPRMAETFIKWGDRDSMIKIIQNTYDFVDRYIDRSLVKEHIGYIVDRVGFETFKNEVLKDVKLDEKVIVVDQIKFGGYWYKDDVNLTNGNEVN